MAGRRRGRLTRSTVYATIGVLGIIYEALHEKTDRPWLLGVFMAMTGLPAVVVGDDLWAMWMSARRKDSRDEDRVP